MIDRLNEMCAHVGAFGRRLNWQLQGRAVVTWEFNSMMAWAQARNQLEDMIRSDPMFVLAVPRMDGHLGRAVDEYTWEMDCRDVTLRLTCTQVMAVQDDSGRSRRVTVRDL